MKKVLAFFLFSFLALFVGGYFWIKDKIQVQWVAQAHDGQIDPRFNDPFFDSDDDMFRTMSEMQKRMMERMRRGFNMPGFSGGESLSHRTIERDDFVYLVVYSNQESATIDLDLDSSNGKIRASAKWQQSTKQDSQGGSMRSMSSGQSTSYLPMPGQTQWNKATITSVKSSLKVVCFPKKSSLSCDENQAQEVAKGLDLGVKKPGKSTLRALGDSSNAPAQLRERSVVPPAENPRKKLKPLPFDPGDNRL